MNENWYWQLAQERQRELRKEAENARLLREAGIQDIAPEVLQALGLFLLTVPVALVVALVVSKL
jgi:hypothetical protein